MLYIITLNYYPQLVFVYLEKNTLNKELIQNTSGITILTVIILFKTSLYLHQSDYIIKYNVSHKH